MPSFDEIAKRQAAKTIVKLAKPRSESGKRSLEEGEVSPKRVKVTPVPVTVEPSQISFKTLSEPAPKTPIPFQVPAEKIAEIEKQLEENRRIQAAAIATKTPPSPALPESVRPTILEMKKMTAEQIRQLDGKNLYRFVSFNRHLSLKLMEVKEYIFKVGYSGRAQVMFRPSDLDGVLKEDNIVFFQEFAETIREWGFKTSLKNQTLDIYW